MDKKQILNKVKGNGDNFSPCPITDETPKDQLGSYAEEIKSNDSVTGNLLSRALYDQTDNGPYDAMTKRARINNIYLEKIAMSAKSIHTAMTSSSPIAKASLGLSIAGLGLSAANYRNGQITAKTNTDRANLERKSLTALNNINKSLSTAVLAPATMATPRPKSMQ